MTDVSAIVSNIASLAGMANLIAHNSTLATAASVAAEGVKLVQEVRDTFALTPEQLATLDTSRELFEAAVNEHATRTAASLG